MPTSKLALLFAITAGLAGCGAADGGPATPRPPAPGSVAPPTTPPPVGQSFAAADAEYVFADPDRRKKLESAFPAIDTLIEAHRVRWKIPGAVVGIVIDGELAHTSAAGVTDLGTKARPDADTVFALMSVTKTFTALAVLALRDDGALSLDDPLTRWMPEASGLVYPTRDSPPISLRHLLTHTSGLPKDGRFDSNHGPTEQDILKSLSGFAIVDTPGRRFSYSNLGYKLLGIVVGRAARAPFRDALTKRILAPIGMMSTVWDATTVPQGKLATPHETGADGEPHPSERWDLGAGVAAGGLHSSVRDVARYVAFQLAAYPPRSGPETGTVRRSTVREAHSKTSNANFWQAEPLGVQLRVAEAPKKGERTLEVTTDGTGYGWAVTQNCDFDNLVWHAGVGGGYTSMIQLLPEYGVGVIALTNLRGQGLPLKKVVDALRATGGLSKRSTRSAAATKPPAAFEPAMKKFLAVYNSWDERAYAEMLTKKRDLGPPEELAAAEKQELAGYKKLHGACKGYSPVEMVSALAWRFKLDCERGTLVMEVTLGAGDGLIWGFAGTSRDLELPPDLRKAATRLLALVGRWDEAAYKKSVAKTKQDQDAASYFEGLRWAHGSCSVKGATHDYGGWKAMLSCERGGDLSLALAVDPKDANVLAQYAFQSRAEGLCPVR